MADAIRICAISGRAGRGVLRPLCYRLLEPCFRATKCRDPCSDALAGGDVCEHCGQGAIQEMAASAKRFHFGTRRESFALLAASILLPGMACLVRLFSLCAWLPVGLDHFLLSPAHVLFFDHSQRAPSATTGRCNRIPLPNLQRCLRRQIANQKTRALSSFQLMSRQFTMLPERKFRKFSQDFSHPSCKL